MSSLTKIETARTLIRQGQRRLEEAIQLECPIGCTVHYTWSGAECAGEVLRHASTRIKVRSEHSGREYWLGIEHVTKVAA